MSDEADISHSRVQEMRVYLDSMKNIYKNALLQNGEVYDVAAALTQSFRTITPKSILADSRIIKILRYAIAPSISQMKLGQIFNIPSIGPFENDKIAQGTAKYRTLKTIASEIALFTKERLDRQRFPWLDSDKGGVIDTDLAQKYAKNWTCSIAADQNAQTKFRNWRKCIQEHAVASELVKIGYTRSTYTGIISEQTDVNLGEYTQEMRVLGRTKQKADLVARSKSTKRLVLIEAKAVGVEIDSTKRIKECCDKASDWRSSKVLNQPVVIAVIGGFFNLTGIDTLRASKIEIIWEHRLSDLRRLL